MTRERLLSPLHLTSALLVACIGLGVPVMLLSGQSALAAKPAVLVTGASSGIGRTITETLASRGHHVYAGARKPEDLQALNAIDNVQAVKLDVTASADIAAAVETIRRAGRGLHGVVNNAGVAAIAPLIEMEERELTSLFDVNVFGPYRITKAFTPMLIESKGRVVNISSISGILSGPLLGAYSMSKHAVEAYGDALSAELARSGVKVSLIEPGNYRSEIEGHRRSRTGRDRQAASGKDALESRATPWSSGLVAPTRPPIRCHGCQRYTNLSSSWFVRDSSNSGFRERVGRRLL